MITHKIKNIALGIMAILLLISGTAIVLMVNSAKKEQQARMIDHERSNTIIATQRGQILVRDSLIAAIRKERHKDSLENSTSQKALKARVATLTGRISKLPQKIFYNPDSATVDSLRVAFVLKDSVIDTQQLMIMSLEVEKTGIINSFYKEISQLEDQRESQVDISNQLQNQLVESQTQTRKEVRRKKFWRGAAMLVTGGIAVLLLSPK